MKGLFLICLCGAWLSAWAVKDWPEITSVHRSYTIKDADTANVSISINSTSRRPLYRLTCAGPDAETKDLKDNDFSNSGDFECWLKPIANHSRHPTLFTELHHPIRDWQSRGRFFASEVLEPCADIPDFGRKRSFRVRGMKITLTLSKVTLSPLGKLGSFQVTIDAVNDPTAKSEITAHPPFPRRGSYGNCQLNNSGQYSELNGR